VEFKILNLLAEYGPLGIALGVVAVIWFKTSKDHQEVVKLMAASHERGMNRVADALNTTNENIAEVNRNTAEIKGIVSNQHCKL